MATLTAAVVAGGTLANSVYQGNKASKAAKQAARMQAQSTAEGQALTRAAQEQLRSDLAPFRAVGETALPALERFATESGADKVSRLEANPLFQAALNVRDRETLGRAAQQGRIGTGDTSQQLAENFLLSASPLLQQEEQRFLNLANIAQPSAAQSGMSGLQAAQSIGNTGMLGAQAQSAGVVASQQAQAQRNQQILQNLPTLISSINAAMPTGGPATSPIITQFPEAGRVGVV